MRFKLHKVFDAAPGLLRYLDYTTSSLDKPTDLILTGLHLEIVELF